MAIIRFQDYALFVVLGAIFLEGAKFSCVFSDEPYHLLCYVPGMPTTESPKEWIGLHLATSILHVVLVYQRISGIGSHTGDNFDVFSTCVFIFWSIITAFNAEHLASLPPVVAVIVVVSLLLIQWWTWVHRDLEVPIRLHFSILSLPILGTTTAITIYLVKTFIGYN